MPPEFFPLSSIILSAGPEMDKLAADPRASVEPLGRILSEFVEDLKKTMPYKDPIPTYLLPEGAQIIKLEKPDAVGFKYCLPLDADSDFDCKAWVKEYELATGAQFTLRSNKFSSGSEKRTEFYCIRSGHYASKAGQNPDVRPRLNQKESIKNNCRARITCTLKTILEKDTKKEIKYMSIEIVGHNTHDPGSVEDIGKMRLSREIRSFIMDRIIEGLDAKGVKDIFKTR
ncbi:hypothetical protein BGX34_005632 [Mortierella sp. NVP85]|nr:hypothetical protein BGX34_005632 [Mortierella sp. NVP85]